VLLLSSTIFAQGTLQSFVKAYETQDMSRACSLGRDLYRAEERNEKILLAIGHACAKDDFIDFIGVLQQRLGQSPSSRRANVYFSTLILKKRLIIEYMHEGADLSFYTLPKTEHILSKVFEAIKSKDFTLVIQNPKKLHIGGNKDYIEVYENEKIYVDVFENGKKIQEHRYR